MRLLAAAWAACPVQLLAVRDGGLVVAPEGLAALEALDGPAAFVPALGVYRSGKSSLLNFLRGGVEPEHQFGVGHTDASHTHGLWVCPEKVGDTWVVWTDTEGLWSTEDAAHKHGAKIFSAALLLADVVVLNQREVLSDQFVTYLAAQQQQAAILRRHLLTKLGGADSLVAQRLRVLWLIQAPMGPNTKDALRKFLQADPQRTGLLQQCDHEPHTLPAPVYDVRLHKELDRMPLGDLAPEYLAALGELRETLVQHASGSARHLSGLHAQLRLFLELLDTAEFSEGLAREAFEEAERARICGQAKLELRDGGWDKLSTRAAFTKAEQDARRVQQDVQLAEKWVHQVQSCVEREEASALSRLWERQVRELAQQRTWFLPLLDAVRQRYEQLGLPAADPAFFAAQHQLAVGVQRDKVALATRVRDVVNLAVPWVVAGFVPSYTRYELKGVGKLGMHFVLFQLAVWIVAPALHVYSGIECLSLEYPLLEKHSLLLDIAMAVASVLGPGLVQEVFAASHWLAFGTLGLLCARAAWQLKVRPLVAQTPKPGDVVGGVILLDRQVKFLLHRDEVSKKEQWQRALTDANRCALHQDGYGAIEQVMSVLVPLKDVTAMGEDVQMKALLDPGVLDLHKLKRCVAIAAAYYESKDERFPEVFLDAWADVGQDVLRYQWIGKCAKSLQLCVDAVLEADQKMKVKLEPVDDDATSPCTPPPARTPYPAKTPYGQARRRYPVTPFFAPLPQGVDDQSTPR